MTVYQPEDEHCHGECTNTYDAETFELIDEGEECAHCDCCCPCLACEYGPRDGMLLHPEQPNPAG
ncbi:hypothetical protein GCM10010112_43790 [Actinoplanes lobatus]|uniref:Uncharacterized protein n=1 Tax=Actinoplanes lobatus TaxID=113568 RepID=A0A7W7HBP4_9ACTN|nr:hypothetical protein [Actinoplanes lobatus]MBB4747582.1 hypothetical protein [Actinoplanes lobatus]GGN74044.1 hypothetical protein GCM10010112_43790 [Actinoplanes lobatus]GIE39857.1 hypothetical protein Alo02nite_27550 [Actinoplanes lobatus]